MAEAYVFQLAKEILFERARNSESLIEFSTEPVQLADSGLKMHTYANKAIFRLTRSRHPDYNPHQDYGLLVDILFLTIVPDNDSKLNWQASYKIYIGGQEFCVMNIDAERVIADWLRLRRIFVLSKVDIPITWFWIQSDFNVWAVESSATLVLQECNITPAAIVEYLVPLDELDCITKMASLEIAVIYKTIKCFAGFTTGFSCISKPLFLFVTGDQLAFEPNLAFEIVLDFYKKGEKIHLSDSNVTPIRCKSSQNTVLLSLDDDYISCEDDARDMVQALSSKSWDNGTFPWHNTVGCAVEINLKFEQDVFVSCIDLNTVLQMGNSMALRHTT